MASSSGNDRLVADAGNGDHAADQDYTHKVDRAVLGQSGELYPDASAKWRLDVSELIEHMLARLESEIWLTEQRR